MKAPVSSLHHEMWPCDGAWAAPGQTAAVQAAALPGCCLKPRVWNTVTSVKMPSELRILSFSCCSAGLKRHVIEIELANAANDSPSALPFLFFNVGLLSAELNSYIVY